MNPTLNYEAEPLELEEESSHCGGDCPCQKCRAHAGPSHEADFEYEHEAPEGFEDFESALEGSEADFEAAGFEDFEAAFEDMEEASFTEEPQDCGSVAVDCDMLSKADQKLVRKAGAPDGNSVDRTVGDPAQNLALQLTDYDVNEWRPGLKERHRRALEAIESFIKERREQIMALPNGIQVSISGASSHTGSKEYNDILSCKRAKCVHDALRVRFEIMQSDPAFFRKLRFKITGEGFENAKCEGKQCEIGAFRSVLVSVHRPEKPPKPVPIEPPGWDKFRIRNCSYKTETLGEVIVDELLKRGLEALPEPLRRRLGESPAGKKFLEKGIALLIKKLKEAILKAPGLLGKALREISGALKFIPVEIIRDTGIFQIVERAKPDVKELVLRYSGFGFRVVFPREIPGLPKLPDFVLEQIKKSLQSLLKLDDFGVNVVLKALKGKIPDFSSTTPGPFKDFDTNKKVLLRVFECPSESLKGLLPGVVFLGFSSRRFTNLDTTQRTKISCNGCQSTNQIPVEIGDKTGFELVAPTKGDLVDCACKCVESPVKQAAVSRLTTQRLVAQRKLAARRVAFRRSPKRTVLMREY